MSPPKRIVTCELDAVLKQQDGSELDQSDKRKVTFSSTTSSRGRREASSGRNDKLVIENRSDDIEEADCKEELLNSLEGAAFLSRLPFDKMSCLEMEHFSDLQGPSRLALIQIRNRILKMWFENPKKQLTEYDVQKIEAPYNSDPALVSRTHTFLERHGFFNYGLYEHISPTSNSPSADMQTIKQNPEDTQHHVFELPVDLDRAYSLGAAIKEEKIIGSAVSHTLTSEYSNMQKIKQNPEETQHHVVEVPLDLDRAYSLGAAIKEEKIIGPAVTHTLTSEYSKMQKIKQNPEETQHHDFEIPLDLDGAYSLRDAIKEEKIIGPTFEYSSVAVSKIKKLSNKEETEKQTAEETLRRTEDIDEVAQQNTPNVKSKLYDISVSVDSKQEVSKEAVGTKHKIKSNKTVKSGPNSVTVRADDINYASNRVSVTVTCESVLEHSCDICEYSTNNARHFDSHLKAHAAAKNYYCDICSYKTTRKQTLISHLISHSNDRPFVCKTCDAKFKRLCILKQHLRIHSGEKSYFCGVCNKRFIYKASLDRHQRIHTREKFSCDFCPKSFNQKGHLDTHRRIHTGDKPFSCDLCHESFSRKYLLNRHERIHTGEKPFLCDVCHKSFSQKGNLDEHRRIHTGEKPFSCSVCQKSFNRKTVLDTHRLVHTGEKPFSCDVCHKSFSRKSYLNDHQRIHTCEKPFSCEVCHKNFRYLSGLCQHRRVHTHEKS